MNNDLNNQNNQDLQNGGSNNYNGQFNGNIPPQQPIMAQPNVQPTIQQQTMYNPANQQIATQNYNNTNTKNGSKAPIIILLAIIVILLIAVSGLILVLSTSKEDKKDLNPNNQTNNNTEINNQTNNNSNSEENNNSENTTNNNENSEEIIPLNSYANIGEQVEMKINYTYVEDKYNFATRITLKNNGSSDVILSAPGMNTQTLAYYGAYFVPKSIGIANATEDDLINKSCFLKKIIRSDSTETTITSSATENIMLSAGEVIDGIVYCPITNVEDKANGVDPVLFYTTHYTKSGQKIKTTFDTRNSMQ